MTLSAKLAALTLAAAVVAAITTKVAERRRAKRQRPDDRYRNADGAGGPGDDRDPGSPR